MSETELEHLRRRLAFQARLDDALESASVRRVPLAEALDGCLPALLEVMSATQAWVETLDEGLQPRVFSHGPEPSEALVARAQGLVGEGGADGALLELEGETLFARRLDVAGRTFGTLAALVPTSASTPASELEALLHVAAEELDDYLAAVRNAREKQRLLREIHDELRHPIVSEGVRRAVSRIDDTVRFDLLIVIYHLEEDTHDSVHYLVFRGRQLEFATGERVASELDTLLAESASASQSEVLIRNAELEHRRITGEQLEPLSAEDESEELLRRLGYEEYLETLLIGGVEDGSAVGKVVVGSRRALTTYERDVFDLFADVLQKRCVDYSRTGRELHRTFGLPTVVRLLDQPSWRSFLAPRAAEISILYADVSGFTRLSEQILRDPAKVGELIEVFSREAVRILWGQDGVFDKLVGDCVIGLFGPPFYDSPPAQRALACARAAAAISRWTRLELPKSESPAIQEIVAAGEPLGVAIGINHCPVSVGMFGPNQDFTAFSPGMNNAARLQGLAVRDEVLVLEPMRALIEEACPTARFSELRSGKVKNVAEPLRYYSLDTESV